MGRFAQGECMVCVAVGSSRSSCAIQFQKTCTLVSDWRTAGYLLASVEAHAVQGLQRILLIDSCSLTGFERNGDVSPVDL